MKLSIYKTFTEEERGTFKFDGKLSEVIDSLVAIRAALPENFRENAVCDISASDDGYGCEIYYKPTIEITSWRLETDEEEQARVDLDKAIARDKRKKKKAENYDTIR